MDDSIQNAIRIGERSKEIIELAHNWCAHLQMSEKCPTLSVIFAERPTGMQLHRDRQCDVKFSSLSIGRTF